MNEKITLLKQEIAKIIVGQEATVNAVLTGFLCDGHILLEGVPGLAKTTLVKTMSKATGLDFHRVQFTPDLLPSDITGTQIYNPKTTEFSIKRGPIFTNILLADEINRSPAKVQSALLEVMQERQVTIGDESFKVDEPFLVLATQNPIEQEGAYALPEAQLDRFMFKVVLEYNNTEEEFLIAKNNFKQDDVVINEVLSKEDLIQMKSEVRDIHIDDELIKYIVSLIDATRNPSKYKIDNLTDLVSLGASPRGTIDLLKSSKATAYLRGSEYVTPVDIGYVFKDALRHRIGISYEAEAKGFSSDDILSEVLKSIPIP